jgi:hypothetical protein
VAADRPACARLLAVAPAGRSAASYTITRDTTQRIAAMVRDNPAVTAYRVAKAVGCDVKTAAKYASGPRSAP